MNLIQTLKSAICGTKRKNVPAVPKFQEMAVSYSRRLVREWSALKPTSTGPHVGVVVTPWMFTPAPFFALECGLALAAAGCRVTWLWDSEDVFFNAGKPREIKAIEDMFNSLPPGFERISVHDSDSGETFDDEQFLHLLIYENAVRELKGEDGVSEFLARNIAIPTAMRQHVARVKNALSHGSFDWLLIPGGVWAASGIYARMASRLGIDYTSYDSGPGEVAVARGGPAAHFVDVAPALQEMQKLPDAERDRLVILAENNLRVRMAGEDENHFQAKPSGSGDGKRCDILVPLNYRADTAALCRQKIFESVSQWVHELCAWVEEHPPFHLAIRQHPCERIPEFRGNDQWERDLGVYASFGTRIRLVKAEDDVNTYDLLSQAKVVLPFTSRIGIEAAMMKKPVILGSHCYYSGCGFTYDAESKEKYFSLLQCGLAGGLIPDSAQSNLAGLCYYIAEKCLFVKTSFTPQPFDFLRWVVRPQGELWSELPQQAFLSMMLARENSALSIDRLINRQ